MPNERMRIKKWFMLQVWRLQQVSQVMTLALLALSLSTQIWGYIKYRGELFANPYAMIPIIMIIIAAAIWSVSIFWDLRLKMWRDQATVLVERNPYSKEKMTAKEIALYGMTWLPIMEKLGENDPKMKERAEAFRAWLRRASGEEPDLEKDLREILDYMGECAPKDGLALQRKA